MTAAAALALSACAPEDDSPAADDTAQVEDSPSPETEEAETDTDTETDQTDEATDEGTETDDATDERTEETETDEATDEPTEDAGTDASGDHPVYQAIDAALAEYPDGVITEFEDNTDDDGYVEVYVYDGSTEWELEVDSETFEIIDTEDDGIDADDEQEAQAVEIDITEALQTAEDESGGQPHEGELDTENGTVVWEFEMDNDVDVDVDVATGDVVTVDD